MRAAMKPWLGNWLNTVNKHYGGLSAFPDAQTVRHMRRVSLDEIEQFEITAKAFVDAGIDYDKILEDWREEIMEIRKVLTDLNDWLAARNLES